MRRFSQRSQMVTLSEINITPLLDLAFVLLIIFVITTPLLAAEHINLKPFGYGGQPTGKKLNKFDIRTVEISSTGYYKLDRKAMPLPQIIAQLAGEFRANPNLVVRIPAPTRTAVLRFARFSC